MKTFYTTYLSRIALLLMLFIAAFYLYEPLKAQVLIAFKPAKKGVTELYSAAPVVVQASDPLHTTVSFSFTISNKEGMERNYDYVVYLQNASGAPVDLGSGKVALKDGASITVPEIVQSLPVQNDSVLVVELPQLHQEIHFSLSQ